MGDEITAEALDKMIHADDRMVLNAPLGDALVSIKVRVSVKPPTSGVTIFGYTTPQVIEPVAIGGGVSEVELPFIRPSIWVERLPGVTTYSIITLEYRDRR
jgi:hypothetical protein